MTDAVCEKGCKEPVVARSLCAKHYARWQRLGTTELPASGSLRNYSGVPVAIDDQRLVRLRASARQHRAVQRKYGVAKNYNCTFCYGRQAAEWAWQHGADPDDPFSYVPLCRLCHTDYDHEIKSALATVHNKSRDQSAVAARLNERRWGKHDG